MEQRLSDLEARIEVLEEILWNLCKDTSLYSLLSPITDVDREYDDIYYL